MSSAPPPTISGPAHGVLASSGQTMRIWFGAGAVPSLAMITLMLLGTFIRVTFASVPSNSSSQRSEPAGFGPFAVAGVSPDVAGALVDGVSEPSAGAGVTSLLVRLPLAWSYFR